LLALGFALYGVASIGPRRAQPITCVNNLKQIGLAFKTWAIDNEQHFPFNVSTNAGGTLELCARDAEGFDSNAFLHFRALSNELATPLVLVCPRDRSKNVSPDFTDVSPQNVTYRMRSGTSVSDTNPQEILAVCPIHSNVLHCDGSVTEGRHDQGDRWAALKQDWRHIDDFRHTEAIAFGLLVVSCFAVGFGTWTRCFNRKISSRRSPRLMT